MKKWKQITLAAFFMYLGSDIFPVNIRFAGK